MEKSVSQDGPTKTKTSRISGISESHAPGGEQLGDGVFSKNNITISSWNVNGIRSVQRKGNLKPYFDNESFDIICFNETKVDEIAVKKDKCRGFFSPEWYQYWNHCTIKRGYSGTMICTKVKPISVKYGIDKSIHDKEGRAITLEFEKFYLVATYIPNAGQKLKRVDYRTKSWDLDFRNYINGLKKTKNTIWCGDLNVAHHPIDIARPNPRLAGYSPQERAQFQQTLDEGWVDTWRKRNPERVKYSWWSTRSKGREKNIGWRLDYFVVNEQMDDAVTNSLILNEVIGSDHCPIELNVDLSKL